LQLYTNQQVSDLELFFIEFHNGKIALRTQDAKYISAMELDESIMSNAETCEAFAKFKMMIP